MHLVTIGVIAKNEEDNIETVLNQLSDQTYDHNMMEIILVNSMSTDRTREIMDKFAKTESFAEIKVFDNPKQTQASSWNVVIKNAKGDLIIRLDAHSLIPADFVEKNVECIDSGESVCGGQRINIIKGDEENKRVLLAAENSMFGSGVAKYRNESKNQYVTTIPHACYKKEVFDKCGLFNENLLRSEDNEMHYRIRANGYKICMSSKISSQYQTRSTLKGMLKQKWGNGEWIGITSVKMTPKIFSLYHFIPALFSLCALVAFVLMIIGVILGGNMVVLSLPFAIGVSLYCVLDVLLTIKGAKEYHIKRESIWLFILFPLLHFSYGLGTIWGLIKGPFYRFKGVES